MPVTHLLIPTNILSKPCTSSSCSVPVYQQSSHGFDVSWTGGGALGRLVWLAGLNAIPVLKAYQADPDDTYLLSLGMGAVGGGITNIDLQGAASMAFHSDPAMLRHDPYR